jgi:hypothetical protein
MPFSASGELVVPVPRLWYVYHRNGSSLAPPYNLQTEIGIAWPVQNCALWCKGQHFFEEIPVIGCIGGHGGRFPSKRPTSWTSFCKCSSTRVSSQAKAVWRDYVPAQRTFIMLGTIDWYVRRPGTSCGQFWGDYAGMMSDRSSRLHVELSTINSNRSYFSFERGKTITCLEYCLSVTC